MDKKSVINMKLDTLFLAIENSRKHSKSPSRFKVPKDYISHCSTNYEHRFKAQKDIIEKQKTTIAMQEKIIEQLKMEIKSKEVVKRSASIESKTSVASDSSRQSTPLSEPKTPLLLIRMQQREEDRRKRWQTLKEQREYKEKIKLEEIAKEEAENKKRALEAKKKKQLEEIAKKQAADERIRYQTALIAKTKIFFGKLTIFIYFKCWLRKARETKKKLGTAFRTFTKLSITRSIQKWKLAAEISVDIKYMQADYHYMHLIMKKCIIAWKEDATNSKLHKESILRMYERDVMSAIFRKWHIYCLKSQVEREEKLRVAQNVYSWLLVKRCLRIWKEIPKLNYVEMATKQRLRNWHTSVQQLLPDFEFF